jgi:hypothetical protein
MIPHLLRSCGQLDCHRGPGPKPARPTALAFAACAK